MLPSVGGPARDEGKEHDLDHDNRHGKDAQMTMPDSVGSTSSLTINEALQRARDSASLLLTDSASTPSWLLKTGQSIKPNVLRIGQRELFMKLAMMCTPAVGSGLAVSSTGVGLTARKEYGQARVSQIAQILGEIEDRLSPVLERLMSRGQLTRSTVEQHTEYCIQFWYLHDIDRKPGSFGYPALKARCSFNLCLLYQ